MVMYQDRIARIESAQLFRIRWYGNGYTDPTATTATKEATSSVIPSGDDLVFLELKTHHEDWVADKSVKERVALRASDVPSVLSRANHELWSDKQYAQRILLAAQSTLSQDDYDGRGSELDYATNLLLTIRHLIIKKDLRPAVRSSYVRVAFQSKQNNSLRFTIDRDIELSSEAEAPLGAWCRDVAVRNENGTGGADGVVDRNKNVIPSVMMPVAVFEVKLNGVAAPEWVSSLLHDNIISDGHKFSKYLSGASMLFEENVKCLPYWAEDVLFHNLYSSSKHGVHSKALQEKPIDYSIVAQDVSLQDTQRSDDSPFFGNKESGIGKSMKQRMRLSLLTSSSNGGYDKPKKIAKKQKVKIEVRF